MRKLASIQSIKTIEAIEGADAIMKATVLGWQLVVKKGEFQEGDLCVYIEIDSLLPEKPEFEFLKSRGMRIRTIRLRGQISQGICLPVSIFPEVAGLKEDTDVTEILGITKYEAPMPASLQGIAKGSFPGFMPKTDETRIQILQSMLDRYVGTKCFITEKLDGSSVTYFFRNGEFGVCSRNLELIESPENSLWEQARLCNIEEKLRSMGHNLAIQGEIVGEGINGNKYKLRGQKVYFFNAFDIDRFKFFSLDAFVEFFKFLELPVAPLLETDYVMHNDIPQWVKYATGKSTLFNVEREGIVVRPLEEKQDPEIGRLSFKVISPEFLLKYE